MKNLSNYNINIENQIREVAFLQINATGVYSPDSLAFVQFDDFHAVGSDGSIYQIVDELNEDCKPLLVYKSENGLLFNYAEDRNEFEEDSEDLDIFSHCLQQAELIADGF